MNKDKPFFIYFALNTPHYPYQGYAKWLKHYQKLPTPRNLYAAFVSTYDETIGNLVATVNRLGLRKDTIIIFQSDHGHSHEERAHYGGGSSGPYRGAKFSMFEGGLRVPAIISWPGSLPEDKVRDQLTHSCDWLPTIAELTKVKLLKKNIDGKSIVKVIKQAEAKTPHDVLHWQTGRGRQPRWAVRQGDWKLIGNPQDTSNKAPLTAKDKLFLVNLNNSVSEMKNLAQANPEITNRLKKLHDDWAAQNVK
jgi:arylsulfatase A-like enzyme